MRPTAHAAALLALLSGCSSTKPTAARTEVGEIVADRGGPADVIAPEQDASSAAQVRERVAELLAKPLTVGSALQVALLNNRGLRVTLEELGVAQADLVQAGLLENPVVAGNLIISTAGNGFGGGLSLSQSLLSAFLIPAKRRLANAQLRVAVVNVADATLGLVRDVKVAYADAQAAVAARDLHRTLVQGAEVADELAQRQHEAGNLTDLDRELFASALDEARLELADYTLEVVMAREELNRLLGLWGAQVEWKLGASLPDPGQLNVDLTGAEALGIRQRLDISSVRSEVEAIEYAIKLRRRGVVPNVEAGVEAGNEVGDDVGHEWVVGPSLSLEVPLFDPGHADFARLRAYLRQAQHRLQHTAIVARSQIRTQREALVGSARRVEYIRDTVLPRRVTIGARALERYNAMLIGAYELLHIREEQVESQHAYVRALRDYWVARAQLERAVGGRLPQG